jgi:hypothetical protein
MESGNMSKTLLMTMIALTTGGIAMTALPTASAYSCAATEPGTPETDYVAWFCTYYIFGGEAERDVWATVGYVEGAAFGAIQFVWDTFGDDLPPLP